MAAIGCAGAGRALLRRSPGLLWRTAGVGEPGLLQQHPIGALSSLSSNRYMSSYGEDLIQGPAKKKLAAELMKEPRDDKEIENLDKMLRLINSTKDNYSFKSRYESSLFADAGMSDSCRQQAAARTAIEAQKLELVSDLLRPAGTGQDCKKKMDELAVAVRSHRQSLVIEDLISKYEGLVRKCEGLEDMNAKMIVGMVIWGLPITIAVLAQICLHWALNLDKNQFIHEVAIRYFITSSV